MKNLCLLLFCTVWSLAGSATDKNFRVLLTDERGASIGGGQIFVRPESSKGGLRELLTTETHMPGTAELELKPGVYDVFISAVGFDPFARKIEVLPNKPVNLRLKLKVSRIGVTGDEFSSTPEVPTSTKRN